jgi:hypothetical protein
MGVLLILLAIAAYLRFRNRSKRAAAPEEIVTNPKEKPCARLHPENEPLDCGRLGNEINAKSISSLTGTQNDVSEDKIEEEEG